ncbi:hypothetical protein [Flavobacterium ustbae]|uniref:hypothetical protein n=1 Tax=Flavobacterium ustbae TaxID=2488790 RepID=UPI000F7787FE|nr:hypothetical protein [Flavobacterium ustbae]
MKTTMKKVTSAAALACFMTIGIQSASAQVGMSGNNPDKSAALDLNATNKGLLVPRVNLTSLSDKASINGGNPAVSLMVYNTNATLGAGFYYWNGTAWVKLSITGDGDNLGDHTAIKDLNMNSKNINNVNIEYFKDQVGGNPDTYSLTKNNGNFGIYSSKNKANDLYIEEGTRKTVVQKLAVNQNFDDSKPIVPGSVATSADNSGNLVWKDAATFIKNNQVQSDWNTTNASDASFIKNKPAIPTVTGAETKVQAGNAVPGNVITVNGKGTSAEPYAISGDNLGNHTATTTLNMANKDIDNINNAFVNYELKLRDRTTTNTKYYGFNKVNGVLGVFNSNKQGNDIEVDEGTRKTTLNNIAISNGTTANNKPLAGYVAISVDDKGSVDWKDPATIGTKQVQADWNTINTSDASFIKNKPAAVTGAETKVKAGTAPITGNLVTVTGTGTATDAYIISGDNLGNHIAMQDLNMSSKNINNVNIEYFKDQVGGNPDTYSLTKNNGNFGIYSSKNKANDLYIEEGTRKTVVRKLAVNENADGSAIAQGYIATSSDNSGNLIWKDPATIGTKQVQADWNTTNTSDASFIKNKPAIPTVTGAETKVQAGNAIAGNLITVNGKGTTAEPYAISGDNLGNHIAMQDLNMSSKNINNVNIEYFKDQVGGNPDTYSLTKNNGIFGIYSSKNKENDLYIEEGSRKTVVQKLAVNQNADDSKPIVPGSVATSLDNSGNLVWKDAATFIKNNQVQADWNTTNTSDASFIKNKPSITGAETIIKPGTNPDNIVTGAGTSANPYIISGDNLGNHKAARDLDMSSKNITSINRAEVGYELQIKDRTTTNTNYFGLNKIDGKFGVYNSKASAFALNIDESSNVGIGTTTPSKKLEVNGTAKVADKMYLGTAAKAPQDGVSQLVRDNTTGEVYAVGTGAGNTKAFNSVRYIINNVAGDFVNDLDIKVNAADYTVIVVGSSFDPRGGGLKASNGGTFTPLNVYAFIQNGTWHLSADYAGGTTSNNLNGNWTLYCMIINNSMVNTLGDQSVNLSGNSSGSMPAVVNGL